MDLEEQYNKIYRYCYFKVRSREIAEDITQETFLRFLESGGQSLQYLYTIAHNLCIDEYRKPRTEQLDEETQASFAEEEMLSQVSVRLALSALEEKDREVLLLRYVNEVPVSVIGKLYGISRFAVYRKVLQATKNLKEKLGREEFE